jgi:hypothetical protein
VPGCTVPTGSTGSSSLARRQCENAIRESNSSVAIPISRRKTLLRVHGENPTSSTRAVQNSSTHGWLTLRAGKLDDLSRDSINNLPVAPAHLGFVRSARSLLVEAATVLYADRRGQRIFTAMLTPRCSPAFACGVPRCAATHEPFPRLGEAR